jgi:hypothetical protein
MQFSRTLLLNFYSPNCVIWRKRCTIIHGLGVMQIAIGQGGEKGKKRIGRKGDKNGDIKENKLSLFFQLAFYTSNVKLHYTSINQFPIRRVSPYS